MVLCEERETNLDNMLTELDHERLRSVRLNQTDTSDVLTITTTKNESKTTVRDLTNLRWLVDQAENFIGLRVIEFIQTPYIYLKLENGFYIQQYY